MDSTDDQVSAIVPEDYMSCPFQDHFQALFMRDAVNNPSADNTVDNPCTDENGVSLPDPDPNYHEIDPNGDIVLNLNIEPEATKEGPVMKLRISSTFLSFASPVFEKMFKGDFEEAHRIRMNAICGNTTQITLPEDNAEAMKELCDMIHHRETQRRALVSRGLHSVWETVVLAQKYQCLHVVKDKFDCYLYRSQKWTNSTDVEAIMKILVMSSLFENNLAFRGASEVIIENSNWSLNRVKELAQMVVAPLDVDWLCEHIDATREEKLSKLHKGIHDIGTSILEQGHLRTSQEESTKLSTVECRASRWLSFGETMNAVGMPPYERGGNIKDILRKIRRRGNMKFGGCIKRKCKCRAPDLGTKLIALVDSIKIRGLDLSEFNKVDRQKDNGNIISQL